MGDLIADIVLLVLTVWVKFWAREDAPILVVLIDSIQLKSRAVEVARNNL